MGGFGERLGDLHDAGRGSRPQRGRSPLSYHERHTKAADPTRIILKVLSTLGEAQVYSRTGTLRHWGFRQVEAEELPLAETGSGLSRGKRRMRRQSHRHSLLHGIARRRTERCGKAGADALLVEIYFASGKSRKQISSA